MKKVVFFIVAFLILGVVLYVAYAMLKITVGLILLAVSIILLTIIYFKIKHRLND
jgi:hypothetical protein